MKGLLAMTNAEILAAETPAMRSARVGHRTEVSQSRNLARSHELFWSPGGAEIRDNARGGEVVFRGTLAECQAEAERRGLWY